MFLYVYVSIWICMFYMYISICISICILSFYTYVSLYIYEEILEGYIGISVLEMLRDLASIPELEDPLEEGMEIPTPVLLPGESHGQRSQAGYSPWGRRWSDTSEIT